MRNTLISALLVLLVLPGCSWIRSRGDDEPGDPAPLVVFDSTLKVGKVWSTQVGDGMGKQGLTMGPFYSSGNLFAADYEGRLLSVNADNGHKNWELKTRQPFSGGPGIDDDHIYMGTIDGRVVAFDRNNGDELWNAQVSSEVLVPPIGADDIVASRR